MEEKSGRENAQDRNWEDLGGQKRGETFRVKVLSGFHFLLAKWRKGNIRGKEQTGLASARGEWENSFYVSAPQKVRESTEYSRLTRRTFKETGVM